MQRRLLVPVFLQRSLLLVPYIALNSCQPHKANSGPSIDFTHIPSVAQSGRERIDTISGRVRNARPKQQIVIYAHREQWWMQPWPYHPFIPIKAGSTWSPETRLGLEYAALLVEPHYPPLPTMDVAPTQGGSFALVTIVKSVGPLQFAATDAIPRETMAAFESYSWPGNNLVERAVIVARDGVLPNPLRNMRTGAIATRRTTATRSSPDAREAPRVLILETLEQAKWIIGGPNDARAKLGLKRTTFAREDEATGDFAAARSKVTDVLGMEPDNREEALL